MAKRVLIALLALMSALFATGVVGSTSSPPELVLDTLASGGGESGAGAVILTDTLGQPLAGWVEDGVVAIEVGFWIGVVADAGPTATHTAGPSPSATVTRTATWTPTPTQTTKPGTLTPTATRAHGLHLPLVARYW